MVTDQRTIGEAIERKLDDLQARVDPRVADTTIELLQLVSELYAAGLARVLELADRDAPHLVQKLAADDLIASLLVANGLHPDTLEVRVERAIDSVRPFLAGHGGDVELLDVDDQAGAVHLRLLGSCDGCPSSAITLRTTVERAIVEAAPEVTIIDVEEPATADVVAVSGEVTPVALTTKRPTFDPATGCGAALPTEVGVP